MGPGTRSVWAGEHGPRFERATQVPVTHSVAFTYADLESWEQAATGVAPGHIYGRNSNPTVSVFEEKIRDLEGAEAATSFATGMAAIAGVFHALLASGDRIVSVKDTYGGTNLLFVDFLPRFGIEVELQDTDDVDGILAAIGRGCDVVHLETPTNPTLKVVDVRRLAAAAHEVGAVVVVDNTLATPINQRPIELGADLVVHSATKFLGGHADALGGVACGAGPLIARIHHFREIHGASLHPTAAYLLLRGMHTLELRVERHNRNAQAVAEYLNGHERVDGVWYPGLPNHPAHDVAASQMSGFGGVLGFSVEGGWEAAKQVLERLRLAHLAAHLGSVTTIAGPPRTTSHVELTERQRAAAGIPESLIRYSAGIENVDDLLADLQQALHAD